MRAPADIIRQLLIDLGLGAATGDWTIYVSFFPDTPDKAICIYDTAGIFDGRLMENGFRIEHPGIQIQVRAQIYPDLWDKANTIATTLDAQMGTEVIMESAEAYTIHNISRTGAILPIGIEEEGDRRRHYVSINAVITLTEEN